MVVPKQKEIEEPVRKALLLRKKQTITTKPGPSKSLIAGQIEASYAHFAITRLKMDRDTPVDCG